MDLGIVRKGALMAAVFASLVVAPVAGAFSFDLLGTMAGDPPGYLSAVGIDASDAGDSFGVTWSLAYPALSAEATFMVASYADDAVVLDITLRNTTELPSSGLLDAATILSLGFGVDVDMVAALTTPGTLMDNVSVPPGGLYPGGFEGIDVCIFADRCFGGPVTEGIQAGGSDHFVITLLSNDEFANGFSLGFLPLMFRTSHGLFELPGSPADPGPGPGNPVPEPGAALAFATGALVVGFSSRRRRGAVARDRR